ncbi:MAG: PAS domain S-box protein, partial [Chloroflexi bacterium]|nr:PAS domain S-box protein [Chloroflexota bacterium]
MRQQKSRRSAPPVEQPGESSGDLPARSAGDSPVKSPARRRTHRPTKPAPELSADPELESSAALEAIRRERDEARVGLAAAQQEIRDLQEALEAGRQKQKAGDDAFRRFSDSGLMGIGFFDADGRIDYANPALREMLGLAEGESERGLSWGDLVDPEFADLVSKGFEELKSQGGCTPFEARYFRKDGGHFWALFFGVLFGEKNAAAFILDITRRRELEEVSTDLNHELQHRVTELQRLGSIVESCQDAILTKTLDGIITSWNQAAQRLYGYRPEEIIGRPVAILAPPGLQREMALILERIRAGERVETGETQRVTKDGRRLDISVTVSPLCNAAGELVGASSIARDITRQKHLQRELQERNEQIETQTEELEAQYE